MCKAGGYAVDPVVLALQIKCKSLRRRIHTLRVPPQLPRGLGDLSCISAFDYSPLQYRRERVQTNETKPLMVRNRRHNNPDELISRLLCALSLAQLRTLRRELGVAARGLTTSCLEPKSLINVFYRLVVKNL